MNANEREGVESVPWEENNLVTTRQIICHRGYILGILIAAIIVAELSKDIVFSTDLGKWLPAGEFLYLGMIACLPFLLARIAPKAAGFDNKWLPCSRWQWAWFLGMVFLLIVSRVLVTLLAVIIVGAPPAKPPYVGPDTPIAIVLEGVVIVLIAPVAEEIFFRGYILEQLRKLTRSSTALFIQSFIFGIFHLYTWGLFSSLALFNSFHAFLFGMILGAWRIKFRSLLPLVLVHILFNAIVLVPLKTQYDQATDRSHLTGHTISKETTCITEPLRKDGSVDYVAALNQRFSQGVTPENNAAVLFWKAVGPEEIWSKYRDNYFQMLGIPSLPENSDYFVDLYKYIARQKITPQDSQQDEETQDLAWDLLDRARSRPWSQQEFPVLAEWLAANKKPLALVVEASKCPCCYIPLCCDQKTPLIAVPFPAISPLRKVVWALHIRAMLRLNEGKLQEAWQDLLASHRLARPRWSRAYEDPRFHSICYRKLELCCRPKNTTTHPAHRSPGR